MNMIVMAIVFLVLAGGLIFLFRWLMAREDERLNSNEAASSGHGTAPDLRSDTISSKSSQDFAGIRDIRQGVVIMDTPGEYRLMIQVGNINYALMSDAEKSVVQSGLIQMANAFSFPVQCYATQTLIDSSSSVNTIKENYPEMPEFIQRYALQMIDALAAMRYNRTVLLRHNYIILSHYSREGLEAAQRELSRRGVNIIDALGRIGIKASVMKTNDVMDFLHSTFNRQDVLVASDAAREGGFEIYVKG